MLRDRSKRDRDGLYIRNGSYWLQWRGRRSLRTSDLEVARVAAREFKKRTLDPTYAAATTVSLAHAADEWRKMLDDPNPGTLRMYRQHIGHFVRVLGADLPLARLDSERVDYYLRARRGEPAGLHGRKVGPNTLSKEIGTLRRVLRFAARRGWLTRPIESILPDGLSPEYRPLDRALTEEQLPAFFEAITNWARAATCAFVLGLAADPSTIERARLEDFDAASVLVRGSKTARRFRRVPIVEAFAVYVERARSYLRAYGRFPAWGSSVRDLAVICRRAGLPRITLRDLRRTHGRILRARGAAPALIGEMLRHADSRMAEVVYAGIEVADLGRQVEAATGTSEVRGSRKSTKSPSKSRVA